MAVLALLMAGTSWAVASWVSPWLVLPYLILMALLLFPSAGRPQGDSAELDSDSSDQLPPAQPGEDFDEADSALDGSASAEPSEGGLDSDNVSSPTKARRGKGRSKKAKPLPEPTEATWVQVAPGKFVRVDGSEGSSQAGPHSPGGIPVEVSATPQRSELEEGDALNEETSLLEEPLEDVNPAFEPLEGPEDDPIEGVESESRAALEVDEETGSSGISEGDSAADGNAPQVEESFEETETNSSVVGLEAVIDGVEAEPTGEGSEVEVEESPSSDDLEPFGGLALTDVRPEIADEWGATSEETDPTETPVDETDLDDAGPFDTDSPHELEAPQDADSLESEVFQDPSKGSSWRPGRLAPRAGTRVGHPLRATGREVSPRRLVRSLQAPRQPPDPRRLTRRGAGRPRQIARTFPPRSPPRRSCPPGRFDLAACVVNELIPRPCFR